MADRDDGEAYNRFQRAYCEGAISRTIVPRDSRHVSRQLHETLRIAAITSNERVLEVGCGMGRFTLRLAERGVGIEGLDLSPALLDRLRANGGTRLNIPLHCADLLAPRKAGLREPAVTRFGFLPAFVTDRVWGSQLDLALEHLPVPDVLHAFQIFSARRADPG